MSICNSLHIELHLTCSIVCCTLPCHASLNRTCIILGCASCHVHVWFVYYVVCFFPVVLLLVSSCFVVIVRICSSTLGSSSWLHLLHGLILLPCGISGKMTSTLDLTTIIAMLVASFYRYDALPINCSSSLPNCHVSLSPFSPFLANRCLAMLPLCSAPLIALLVAGEVEDCSMVDRIMLGYHNISYIINASIYFGKGWKARPYAWCFVPLLLP